MNHKIIQFAWRSAAYQKVIELRSRILREPLGLEYSEQDLDSEREQLHYATWDIDAETPVACISVVLFDDGHAKLRQMAVDTPWQGKGVGRSLVEHVESELQQQDVKVVELHAREYALDFYRKLGYQQVGERFTEVGIDHFKMEKRLAD